jgi:hypothetical protein
MSPVAAQPSESDHRHHPLLRTRRERRHGCATEQHNELTPFQHPLPLIKAPVMP